MEQGILQQDGDLYLQDGFWKLCWREDVMDASPRKERRGRKPVWIGPATGPERLTREQAQQIAWEEFQARLNQTAPAPQSEMTIADFVATAFVPEHVAMKKPSGRTHYQAILKYVLTPEEVDRVFQVEAKKPNARLKAIPNWPYLSKVRLCDARPDDIQQLMSAALAHGYSTQTVRHIRSVVSAIFAHAKKAQCFTGDNPASLVRLPEMVRKQAHTLTLTQTKEALEVMRYPEKEMTLVTILTGMNLTEICGLQWKRVNLTEVWSNTDGEPIPPKTIAVRNQWSLGELSSVKTSCNRNLPIPEPLLPILLGLKRRAKFTGPDDFVLVSRTGKPVKQHNIAFRRLKRIGRNLQMPWLSWQVFRRTHKTLAYELGMQLLDRMAMTSVPVTPGVHQK